MKINFTRKTAAAVVLLVILMPIIYNKISTKFMGLMQKKAMMMPKEVVVSNPKVIETPILVNVTGRVEAKYSVDVIARVSGFLVKKYFKEGDFVKKGQAIFQIDPKEYQLQVNNSRATVNQYSALLKNAQQELDRAQALVKEDLISRSDADSSLAQRNQNKALLDAARQQLELARVNLSYTTIKSPIDGRIGKVNITEGNYVSATSGSLVNVSSTNPIYISFSLKGYDLIKLLKASDKLKDVTVRTQFDNGDWYEYKGKIDFVDNKIDKDSGSISLRAVFENPKGWLVPGNYMKIELSAPQTVSFLTVPQSSTKGDAMSGYYVWSVDSNNQAKRKDIKISDEINGSWVVEEGLEQGDNIVVSGIQSVNADGQKLKIITDEEYTKNLNK